MKKLFSKKIPSVSATVLHFCKSNIWLDIYIWVYIQSTVIYSFGWSIEEDPASHRYMVSKRRRIWIAFSDYYCEFLIFLLYQNSRWSRFSKVNHNVAIWNLKLYQWTFYTVTLKIHWANTWKDLLTKHDFCNIIYWSFRKYWFIELG